MVRERTKIEFLKKNFFLVKQMIKFDQSIERSSWLPGEIKIFERQQQNFFWTVTLINSKRFRNFFFKQNSVLSNVFIFSKKYFAST